MRPNLLIHYKNSSMKVKSESKQNFRTLTQTCIINIRVYRANSKIPKKWFEQNDTQIHTNFIM